MRKGISSLCGVVHEKMRSDVRNGGGHTRVSRPATQAPSCTTKRVCGIG